MSSQTHSNPRGSYLAQRTRFSILLALLRSSLPSLQYRGLLRLQALCDRRFHQRGLGRPAISLWLPEFERELDVVFSRLEQTGDAPRIHRLAHLLRDLLLLESRSAEQRSAE